MVNVFIKFSDGQISTANDVETLKRAVADHGAKYWVDLAEPTDAEVALLRDIFCFHPLAVEDVARPQRPKIENYERHMEEHSGGYFFLVTHGPDLEAHDKLQTKELDMFIAANYLVTVHHKPMKSIMEVTSKCAKDPARPLDRGIDMLLHSILDALVDGYFPIFDQMQGHIDRLEDQVTVEPSRRLLRKINVMKRELLNLRRIIAPQREVLGQLTRGEVPFIGEPARIYLRDVQDHLTRAVETIEIYRDLILGARDIYMSSVSNQLNQIMKTLTIITVVALPFTIVTSFFGMNFEAIPGLHSKAGFWIAVAVMFSMMLGLLYLFKVKRWI